MAQLGEPAPRTLFGELDVGVPTRRPPTAPFAITERGVFA
jgi:hypothetical protein